MSETGAPVFPSKTFPESTRAERILGIYPMSTEELQLQRVKVPSGVITTKQWRRLAELAQQYTPGYPLHITTRQDAELHGLSKEDIPAIHQGLDEVGLTTLGAAGDTPRNIICCPGSGRCAGGVDVLELASAVSAAFESIQWLYELPRTFKVSFSGCDCACGKPWIHDVGFVAQTDDTLQVIVAGSLGARPGTGIEFPRVLQVSEVIPFVIAALRLFNAEGDRENRSRARLRHVRERLGDEPFLAELERYFAEELKEDGKSVAPLKRASGGILLLARLSPPLGDVSPDLAIELADAIDAAEAHLQIGINHDLFIYGRKELGLSAELEKWTHEPTIVACPGSTWCAHGTSDSRTAAKRVREALPADTDLTVCISGCPNSCSHAGVADIGLTGRVKTIDGVRVKCFRLLAGGGNGKNATLATELHPAVPVDRIFDAARFLAGRYAGFQQTGEKSFSDFIA